MRSKSITPRLIAACGWRSKTGFKNGELRAVVCSTSLELGIDIGAVDLVVMVATPKGVSRAIQRIGRSGHSLNKSSHGVLVATNINDLVEATATAKLVRQRALDPIKVLEKPYDVLAQHIVGMAALSPIAIEDAIYQIVRRAYPFRDLEREEFDHVLRISDRRRANRWRGNTLAFREDRPIGEMALLLSPIRGSRASSWSISGRSFRKDSSAFSWAGAGSVRSKKDFIKQLQIGDLFVLGGRVVRLIDTGVQEAYVERADGHLPTIPRWNAAKMPLTSGVANAVRKLRADLVDSLARGNEDAEV